MSESVDIVGRERERAEIGAALTLALQSRGGIIVATGEPGIGKSRLMQEASDQAQQRGFAVAWGRGWEMGGAPAFRAWTEALRDLGTVGQAGAAQLAAAQIEPDRFLIFDTVLDTVRAAAAQKPVLILIDDLHAADPASIVLTEYLARQIGTLRLVIMVSHRDIEARANDELWASLMRIARGARVLRLERLSRDNVAALLGRLSPQAGPEVMHLVQDTCDGNPLFVRELIELITARSRVAGRLDVPEGVRAVIRQRLALLSPAVVSLLQAAAVIGRTFSIPVLGAVANMNAAQIREILDEALAAQVIEEINPSGFCFCHVMAAEVLARDLPAPLRTKLYLRTAEALEQHHQGDPDQPLDDIAAHYLEAGPAAAAQALVAVGHAADGALARLAFEQAATWFSRGAELLAQYNPSDTALRAQFLLGQAEAELRAGRKDESLAVCAKLAAFARALASGDLLARAALVLGGEMNTGLSDATLIALLEEAQAALPATDGPLRAKVLARLAGARQPEANPHGPMELARAAIAMARRCEAAEPQQSVLLPVLHFANAALVDYAPLDEQIGLNEEVLALATQRAHRPWALRARMRLAFAHLHAADLSSFEQQVSAYERMLIDFQHPRYRWPLPLLKALRPLLEGRFDDAKILEDQARVLATQANDENGERAFLMRRFAIAANRTDSAELRTSAGAIATLSADSAVHQLFSAHVKARSSTLAQTDCVPWRHEDDSQRILLDPNMRAAAVDIVGHSRDPIAARRLYEAWLPTTGQLVVITGMGFLVQDFVDRLLFVLADVRGDAQAADRHAAAALATMDRLSAHPFAALLSAQWGQALLRRGDETRAKPLLAAARTMAERLGMSGLCAELSDLKAENKVPPARGSGPIVARQEGELWTLSGHGDQCRLKDSRGVRMLAQLLATPGQMIHVLDLSGSYTGVDRGDAGEVLDAAARRAYGERLADLRAERDEAEAHNDRGRAARLAAEEEALRDQLSSAVGLGTRSRRSASAVERARVNVQRRLADAIARIERAEPRLGRALAATIRTGVQCVYDPLD